MKSLDQLLKEISASARLESLVQLPQKSDPDWPKWVARATVRDHSVSAQGDTAIQALERLLQNLTNTGTKEKA